MEILYEVAYFFKSQKTEVPSYNRIVSVISSELSKFEIDLCSIIKDNITPEQKYELERLVTSDTGNYILTTLKIIDHERTPAVIQDGVKNFLIIQTGYNITVPLIKKLNLHIDNVKHYATWVRKASMFQVLQLKSNKRYLYLLCFIQHQYYYRQDISSDILLLSVKSDQNTANREQMQISHQQVKLNNQTISTLSSSRLSYKELVKKIEGIVNLTSISDTAKLNKTVANTYVKFDTKMRPIVKTPKVEKIETKATSSLFAECKYVPILKILKDIQQVVDYLSCFKHHSVKDKQVLPEINSKLHSVME